MKSIIVHTLVKNEARWLWYSVSSVVEYVDKILLWDSGSTDETLEIIKELRKKYPNKIDFKEREINSAEEFTQVRQEMLDETTSDWFLVVDGDEVWWDDSIRKVIKLIQEKGNELESVVVPTINPVGDIFHYQEEAAGKYKIVGKVGHFNLRAINTRIPGLQALGPHGQMGWADGEGKMIQERGSEKVIFVDAPYLHMTHLKRAGGNKDAEVVKRTMKLKYEIGRSFPKDFYYPEAFFSDRPRMVPSPWGVMGPGFKLRAVIETPARKLKRRVWKGRVGY